MSARTISTTITREQIDAAFKALGRLEGLARSTDSNAIALGDSISTILHFAAITVRRKESRKARAAYEKAQIERHETEEAGLALMTERVDDLLCSEVGLAAD